MNRIFTLFYYVCLLTSWIRGESQELERLSPKASYFQENWIPFDQTLAKGLTKIMFLPYVSVSSKEASDKMHKQFVQMLKKWGQVIVKPSSVEHLVEDKNLLHASSLVYQVQELMDITGSPLPVVQASLTFVSSVEIQSSKEHGPAVLWNRQCCIQKSSSMEKTVLDTLPPLLEEFNKTFKNDSKNLTFYVIGL